ncbi:MAG: glycosyltransferase family 39 protein [Roseiflexaceae bacterium]
MAIMQSNNAAPAALQERLRIWLPHGRHLMWLIILIGLAIRLPLLSAPLTYASDIWRQADTASIAHNMSGNLRGIFYPQIDWGGTGPGYVETEFQLYTFLVSLLYTLFGEQLWLGRLVSLIFTFATMIVFSLLAQRILKRPAAGWALAFFALSPLYIRYSVAYMPEATVLFFYVTALYLFCRWLDEQTRLTLLLAACATGLAILVKPTSIHIVLIFVLLTMHRHGWRTLKRWDIWGAVFLSLLPAVLYFTHARNLYLQYGNTFGLLSGGDSKFPHPSALLSPGLYIALLRLETKWLFGSAGVLLYVIGLGVALKRRQPMLVVFAAITISVYYLIVARYAREEWGIQYHIYAIPFAALGMALGTNWLLRQRPRLLMRVLVAGALLSVLVASVYVYRGMLQNEGNGQIACAMTMAQLVPVDAHVIISSTALSVEDGIPNNYQDPVLFFYSHRYGWSLAADQHTSDKVAALRADGAEYFIIYSEELYGAHPDFAAYLRANTEQIGPGITAGCGIYRFSTTPAS